MVPCKMCVQSTQYKRSETNRLEKLNLCWCYIIALGEKFLGKFFVCDNLAVESALLVFVA